MRFKHPLAMVSVALTCFLVGVAPSVAAAGPLHDPTSTVTGTYVAAPQFDNAGDFSEGLAAVEVRNKWGFIDKSGRVVIEPQFNPGQAQFNSYFSDGLAAVNFQEGSSVGDALWGFIDKTGNVVIAPQFSGDYYSPPSFSEGLAAIRVGFKYGYIDKKGRMVIAPSFDRALWFSGGLAVVKVGDKYGYIDKTGALVIKPSFDGASAFSEGLASVTLKGKDGFIDAAGRIVVEPSFDSLSNLSEGVAQYVVKDFSYLDAKGRPVKDAQSVSGDSGATSRYGFVDRTGLPVIPAQFPTTLANMLGSAFEGGLAVVQFGSPKSALLGGGGKYGYIDKTGRVVIAPKFDFALPFSEGLAAVEVDGKYGYIDRIGRMVISRRFDEADDFSDGIARVRLGEKYGFIAR